MEMDMETKNTMVINYINSVREQLEKMDISVSDEAVAQVQNKYLNSPKSFEEIKAEIDKMVADLLEEYKKRQEMLEKMKREQPESITDLDVKTKGITLNMQLIDLLNIVTATQDNLKQVVESLHNLTKEQKRLILSSDKGIEAVKRDLFKMYQD